MALREPQTLSPQANLEEDPDRTRHLAAEGAQLVPKVVSCLQTVGNTISSTSVSRGVFYGPGHQHARDVVLIQW